MAPPKRGLRERDEELDQTLDLLTLALLPGVGVRAARDLTSRAPLREALAHPRDHADLLPGRACSALRTGAAREAAEAEIRRARERGLRIVGRDESDYPADLRQIYDPPPVLYVRGRLKADEGGRSVAIVGSRAASAPGRALAAAMARDLAGCDLTIVSGLARGIDSAAHRGALAAPGRTVAVLGSGLDCLYPPENAALAASIAEEGAIVSEFPLGTPPHRGNFPRRNRIIAGWGVAVVVVEATETSGALTTARAALEEGRDVFAVPGHPSSPVAAGTNQLIRDGAALVRCAADVAAEIGLALPPAGQAAAEDDDVLRALGREAPVSLEELRERCGRGIPELLQRLLELEMGDKVRRLPGALFLRN